MREWTRRGNSMMIWLLKLDQTAKRLQVEGRRKAVQEATTTFLKSIVRTCIDYFLLCVSPQCLSLGLSAVRPRWWQVPGVRRAEGGSRYPVSSSTASLLVSSWRSASGDSRLLPNLLGSKPFSIFVARSCGFSHSTDML
jgi:hypothetical protein